MATGTVDVEQAVRSRLRSLRLAQGLSLEEMAARTRVSASTISRIETGKRSMSLDILLPLARELHVSLDALFDTSTDENVVIRPAEHAEQGRTTWLLSRAGSTVAALKIRLEPTARPIQQQIHPGHDWFFVLHGTVRLSLGDREFIVRGGEAAEFPTMTPHATAAVGAPAELIMIFDRDGLHAHSRTVTDPVAASTQDGE